MKGKFLFFLLAILTVTIFFSGCTEQNIDKENGGTVLIPTINSFTVYPNTIQKGETASLSWVIINATTVSIDNGIGTVESSGNHLISPDITTIYTITASNLEEQKTKTVKIIVEPTDEEIQQLNQQVETLLSAVEERDGFSASITISKTEFLVGEPTDPNGLDYDCAFRVSMGSNPITFQVLGFYRQENVYTFSGSASYSEGTLGSHGFCGQWRAQPVGEYYLFNGIYKAETVYEVLNTNQDEVTAKEIFLNVQPEIYARVSISVYEQS